MIADPLRSAFFPHEDQHDCCGVCVDCDSCDLCKDFDLDNRPPQNLRETVALFADTTDLRIKWLVPEVKTYQLEPTDSGDHLQHLKRLHIVLEPDDNGLIYDSEQADDARMLLDHLHLPSLESISIHFDFSEVGAQPGHDLEAIRKGLCGIASPMLRNIILCARWPMWFRPFPDAWVRHDSLFFEMPPIRIILIHSYSVPQSAIETLILAVVERTNVTSFTMDMVYDLIEDSRDYWDFFVETSSGTRLLPSIVPDHSRFTNLVQQIKNKRSDRPGCSIQIKMRALYLKDHYPLLTAKYDAPMIIIALTAGPLLTGFGHDTTQPSLDDTRIIFCLDEDRHCKPITRTTIPNLKPYRLTTSPQKSSTTSLNTSAREDGRQSPSAAVEPRNPSLSDSRRRRSISTRIRAGRSLVRLNGIGRSCFTGTSRGSMDYVTVNAAYRGPLIYRKRSERLSRKWQIFLPTLPFS